MNLRLDVKSSPLLRCAGCKQTGRLSPQQAVTSEHANRQLQIYTHIPNIHLTDLNIHWHPIQQPAVCVRECVCVCVFTWWSWPARSCWRGPVPGTWSCPEQAAVSLPYISQWWPAAATTHDKQEVSQQHRKNLFINIMKKIWSETCVAIYYVVC